VKSSRILTAFCLLPTVINNSPDRLRFDRHVYMAYAEGRERVNDGANDGGRCANRAGFADAFDAERIDGAGRLRAIKLEPRDHLGARHGVVHECASDKLTGFVIDDRFVERLSD